MVILNYFINEIGQTAHNRSVYAAGAAAPMAEADYIALGLKPHDPIPTPTPSGPPHR
jgi:hypothetical protein